MMVERHQSIRNMIQLAQAGDVQAREVLVRENLALVKYIVRRFLDRGYEYEDLYQYGCMGLVKAIDKFDLNYEVSFSTYAVPVIMGEIRRFIRDDGPVHVARSIQDNARRIEDFRRRRLDSGESDPDLDEIAGELKISKANVILALNSRSRVRSLNEPLSEDSDTMLMDAIGTDTMGAVDMKLTLKKLLYDLNNEERKLIVERYFRSRTQSDIASEMGISQVQVSRMESRIIKKMRDMIICE